MEEKLEQKSADLVRVVLYGPESTGKTTLARRLAQHYQTEWVPEYARDYLQDKWDREKQVCQPEDIIPIAEGQMHLENTLGEKADKVLILDTNLLVTRVYSEAYYNGYVDPLLEKYAIENKYDLYLLTYIDTPWVADDLRDRPDQREEMFNMFEKTLQKYDKPYVILTGTEEERFAKAVRLIDKLIKT
ncbi:AAA family ATPase [Robertkochia flava]|uniref:AAA family ATPase n=1 Tax=Robertkochia flava TaxID=3447986 RepID=UPI001CCC6334|nr:ATP-binding protein [Robertkochia marina]